MNARVRFVGAMLRAWLRERAGHPLGPIVLLIVLLLGVWVGSGSTWSSAGRFTIAFLDESNSHFGRVLAQHLSSDSHLDVIFMQTPGEARRLLDEHAVAAIIRLGPRFAVAYALNRRPPVELDLSPQRPADRAALLSSIQGHFADPSLHDAMWIRDPAHPERVPILMPLRLDVHEPALALDRAAAVLPVAVLAMLGAIFLLAFTGCGRTVPPTDAMVGLPSFGIPPGSLVLIFAYLEGMALAFGLLACLHLAFGLPHLWRMPLALLALLPSVGTAVLLATVTRSALPHHAQNAVEHFATLLSGLVLLVMALASGGWSHVGPRWMAWLPLHAAATMLSGIYLDATPGRHTMAAFGRSLCGLGIVSIMALIPARGFTRAKR